MIDRPSGAAGGAAAGAASASAPGTTSTIGIIFPPDTIGAATSPKRSTGASASTAAPSANATRLASALTKEMLAPVLSDASLRSQLYVCDVRDFDSAPSFPALPAGQAPEEVLQSPQFQQVEQTRRIRSVSSTLSLSHSLSSGRRLAGSRIAVGSTGTALAGTWFGSRGRNHGWRSCLGAVASHPTSCQWR